MKIALMKYLNNKQSPCYKCIREKDMDGTDKFLLEMINSEKEELLFTGEMSKHLWTKLLTEEQYKRLLDSNTKYRIKKLDHMIESLS